MILYCVSRLAYIVQGLFRRVKYITLVNLLAADDPFPQDLSPYDPSQPGADKVPLPEYLTCEDKSEQIANHIVKWLTDQDARQECLAKLREVRTAVGEGGASSRAAEYVVFTLAAQTSPAENVRAA